MQYAKESTLQQQSLYGLMENLSYVANFVILLRTDGEFKLVFQVLTKTGLLLLTGSLPGVIK